MAIKCNNKTDLYLQAAVYFFMGWMFLRNGPSGTGEVCRTLVHTEIIGPFLLAGKL
jgi:hypothetical protein